ncbi:MAG: hypothetical protein HS116_19030 [Planctomycetes bacterium]|nr:hypothetical protein [Planctomycetota bacterium]
MKHAIAEILGKTVSGVVVKENGRPPHTQVFLMFRDGTHYELYGEYFTGAGGVDRGTAEEIKSKGQPGGKIVFEVHEGA